MTGDEPPGPDGAARAFLQSDCEYLEPLAASLIGWYMVTLVVFLVDRHHGLLDRVPAIVSATAVIPVLQVRRTEQLRAQREHAVLEGPWPFADDEQLRTAATTSPDS